MAMRLKIAQKILNLSFNGKILEETENSQENPQYIRKFSPNLAFQIFRGFSKYFEHFDPQNILS